MEKQEAAILTFDPGVMVRFRSSPSRLVMLSMISMNSEARNPPAALPPYQTVSLLVESPNLFRPTFESWNPETTHFVAMVSENGVSRPCRPQSP